MAKTSFAEMEKKGKNSPAKKTASKKEEEVVEVTVTEEDQGAIIVQDSDKGELTLTDQQLNEAGLAGEFDASDINLPRINIVAKTSALVDEGFTPGAIVLNKEATLTLKDKPLRVIVTNMMKQYQEDVAWGSEELPKVFNTEEEVHTAGYSLEWGSPNFCRPIAHITMLIQAPEGLEEDALELFPYENDGNYYALAIYTASKSAYKPTAKEIATYAAFAKGSGVWTTAWSFTSKLRTEGDVSWFAPVMKRSGRLDDEELQFIESIK